ncbi:hypothetical protein [Singulisphaera acidiphila]|uniref:Uncharacterized protein n=1 Tax=Singulisphaera acidiphila (strain ATCC BAA-1392 / DSM 18658 / VKM B-2454 / MOB10) TaxID=886293 RepID=L0DB03_SINAD|nr:hypothetical protein [Singulisphaera acidiphila]AGA26035.1 hypothetical protein Sinac_1657 [Singulisphaera acidiphila DSM 18658]
MTQHISEFLPRYIVVSFPIRSASESADQTATPATEFCDRRVCLAEAGHVGAGFAPARHFQRPEEAIFDGTPGHAASDPLNREELDAIALETARNYIDWVKFSRQETAGEGQPNDNPGDGFFYRYADPSRALDLTEAPYLDAENPAPLCTFIGPPEIRGADGRILQATQFALEFVSGRHVVHYVGMSKVECHGA